MGGQHGAEEGEGECEEGVGELDVAREEGEPGEEGDGVGRGGRVGGEHGFWRRVCARGTCAPARDYTGTGLAGAASAGGGGASSDE